MKNNYQFGSFHKIISLLLMVVLLTGCSQTADVNTDETENDEVTAKESSSTSTWDEATHGNDVEPNYDVVFNQEEVLELTITIDPEDWEAMNADLEENVGGVGNKAGGGGGQGRTQGVGEAKEILDGTESLEATEGETLAVSPGMAQGGELSARPEIIEGEELLELPEVVEGEGITGRPEIVEGEGITGRPEIVEGEGITGRPEIVEGEGITGRPEIVEGQELLERPEIAEGEALLDRPEIVEGEGVTGRQEIVADVDIPVVTEGAESAASAKVLETTEDSDYEPIWVTSTISFEGDTWENVGIRFKGNSSLQSVASSDIDKFSFKLDFDEFEDEYPEIEDQRFYGFKQLNLNNNFGDQSLLHEKVAADLFRDFGVVSAKTSFCAVYVDYGEGVQYFGLYTIVEEVDDTVLEDQFGNNDGNLYKPDGGAAAFSEGSYNESEMEKKNNEDEADYSDVEALYTIINSEERLSDVEVWKDSLEEVFNVDGFLKWLAVNTVIQNWDTYGTMTHNYYLYNDPDTGLLNWIPWDNNEALSDGKRSSIFSLGLTEVGDNWPLISYIIDIPEYKEVYDGYLAQFVDEVFTEEAMAETIDEWYELIQPYAYAEEDGYSFISSDEAFDKAVAELYEHVESRNDAVDAYLNE
jgi:spore coat protein CotH